VQAIYGLRGLFNLGLQAPSHFTEQSHGRRHRRGRLRQFHHGKARHGMAFGVVGSAFGEVRFLVILVTFGFADGQGDGQSQAPEEMVEIGGILAGGVETHMEVGLRMLFM
jgi:hypothetical protein